jgi:hypothetical protein
MYCHNAHNLMGPKAVETKEPVFVCSYQYKEKSTDKGITRVGFITKAKPGNFIDLKERVEDSIFNTMLCPFLTDEQVVKATDKRIYTNMIILTNEPVSFKRRQGNPDLVDEKAYFYLFESNPKSPEVKSRLITMKFNDLNKPSKFSPYGVNCVKESQGVYKLYLHFMKIQSLNYLESTKIMQIKTIKFLENPAEGFSSAVHDLQSNHLSEYRVYFENVPGINEVLVFMYKESSTVKNYEFKSCILWTSLSFGTGNPPFQRCFTIMEMSYEKGMFDQDYVEPGVMKIESNSGIAKFYWKSNRKGAENSNKK